MAPPDPATSTELNVDRIRAKLEQWRLKKPLIDEYLPNFSQFYFVSKYFTPPVRIVPMIYDQKILLECLYTKDSKAYGTIRVHNIAYDKRVFVRLSEDEWENFRDISASHSLNHHTDNTDAFTFEISLNRTRSQYEQPKRILFALCYQVMSHEYWDNNQCWNYVLDVFER